MSTALQTTAHPPAALSSPPLPSPSGRTRTSHSPPGRDVYHVVQGAAASPSSRRQASSRSSRNGVPPTLDLDFSSHHRSTPAATQASDQPSPSSDRRSTMPPVAPPRTSSSSQQPGSSRKGHRASDAAPASQRLAPSESYRGDANGSTDNRRSSKISTLSHASQDAFLQPFTGNRVNSAPEIQVPSRTHQAPSYCSSREANYNQGRPNPSTDDAQVRDGYKSTQHNPDAGPSTAPVPSGGGPPDDRRGARSRHDYSRSHKGGAKFGDFILGNTIGEGEFGKVKLGWKQDSSAQVAIKLIKRDTVGSNPSRLGKIRREVTILRGVQHPNIVQLIDMIETDRYIGIILEYASGGELFDYILNHRYLKDHSARRLFSQLVSGVGYLHKKGIVHRDLKLENLLLDRNRNIIITDFGFANTFDPNDDLSEEEELNLTDREQVKRLGLDQIKPSGSRKGDLMQTSCGSPCYAAPELVVSDSLYTGRKVDVWSCGVILYAMLAGYLPFDDDPANPEGDNINLLYKYIVSTPLTFPEYVTPHARDLLRRILVPNPRKRADLFEVARHSWLSEYAHLVEFITSSTTSPSDIQTASSVPREGVEPAAVSRSASFREASKQKSPTPTSIGGLVKAHANIDKPESSGRKPKDAKRRTVQVEYVAPTTQTQRGTDASLSLSPDEARELQQTSTGAADMPRDKPLPLDPPVAADTYLGPTQSKRPPSAFHNAASKQMRDPRSGSEQPYIGYAVGGRPQTGGSMQSAASIGFQSRNNYGQPVPPTIADTNAQGRIQQPSGADDGEAMGRPALGVPPQFSTTMSGLQEARGSQVKGHKRSSTIGDISSRLLGRSGSVFSSRSKKQPSQPAEKVKKYPPLSYSNAMFQTDEGLPRPSIDSRVSRRSFSLGIGKKHSGSLNGSQGSGEKKERRHLSLLPVSFSLRSVGLGKEYAPAQEHGSYEYDVERQDPRRPDTRRISTAPGESGSGDGTFHIYGNAGSQQAAMSGPVSYEGYGGRPVDAGRFNTGSSYLAHHGSDMQPEGGHFAEMGRPPAEARTGSYGYDFGDAERGEEMRMGVGRDDRGLLQKNHKRFTDAYERGSYRGHEGSSGAAKRVMDFFRRRGKARGGDDR